MIGNIFSGTASIIIGECMSLRDDILVARDNGFLDLEIEGDSKVVVDCYNKKSRLPSSIMILMVDVWRVS